MSEKINVNSADAEGLTTLAGIGPALAQRIIEFRETVHPFEEVIELTAVPGISEKMVRGFADQVTVLPASFPPVVDEDEEPILLGPPDTPELLEPPEQPEALLAADLPAVEEMAVDDSLPEEPVAEQEAEELDEAEAPGLSEEPAAEAPPEASAAEPEAEEIRLSEPAPAVPEPQPVTAASPPPPTDWEDRSRRRGCLNTLLGATFGAILGAVLTLAILAAVNGGSINYAQSNRAVRQELETEIDARTSELNDLSTRVSLVATQEAEANQALATDLAASSEALNDELARHEEIISVLATRSGDLELRLQEVSGAAETFTDFLDGLRLLLDDLDGTPVGETAPTDTPSAEDVTVSPTPTPTPASTEETPEPATATVTATAVPPTRTPQPTATPFNFPTNTPSAQP